MRFVPDGGQGGVQYVTLLVPAYVFLAAPTCSSFITGEILPIIGGYAGG